MKKILCLVAAAFIFTAQASVAVPAFANSKTEATAKKKTTQAKKTKKSQKAVKTSAKSKKSARKNAALKRQQAQQASSASKERYAAVVVDANTGRVLYEKNGGATRYPASLTKMMTLYLTFDALKRGKLKIDQELPVSAKAAGQPQTNIALDEGDRLAVRKAIESLVVRSANDAAVVLAEALAGTEWNFALNMTQKARELGMKNTVFRNSNGLPDNQQHTTAFDMARLGIALRRDFPEYYHYFSLSKFSYAGITYPTHNRVMDRFAGADGIKTGYIRASGFNLVTSVKRGNNNIVAVVMGGASATARDNQMVSLLTTTFAQLENGKDTNVASVEVPPANDNAASASDDAATTVQTAQGN